MDILKKYPHLHWWSCENKGQYATMNEGLAVAKGEIVSFISADDMYITPDAFTSVVGYWRLHPDAKIVYGTRSYVDEQGNYLPVQYSIRRGPLWLYGYTGFISHSSMFLSRKFLLDNELFFDEALHFNGDLDWILRLINIHKKANKNVMQFFNFDLSLIRHHNQRATVQFTSRIIVERRKVFERYGISFGLYEIITFITRWVSLFQKGTYTLQVKGLQGLMDTWREWRFRQGRGIV